VETIRREQTGEAKKMATNGEYNLREYLAYLGSIMLEDKKSVFVGTGLPIIAAVLAQKTHAPNLLIVFEAGGIGPQIPELPISVGEGRTFHKGVMATSMHDVMSMSQSGHVDFGFLGAAQIDMYGNINTTVIGNHDHPKTRLPGSGGASDVSSFSDKLITIIAKQSKKTLVNKLDFLTSAGYLDGPGAREKAGLPRHSGPFRVVTQLGIFGFNESSKRLELLSTHPDVTVDQVKENSSFDILLPAKIEASPTPPKEYLEILRKEIDPTGIVLGK
jgi:acyl CoA:acetate/3-ketoacid CoA transferase beta subunit